MQRESIQITFWSTKRGPSLVLLKSKSVNILEEFLAIQFGDQKQCSHCIHIVPGSGFRSLFTHFNFETSLSTFYNSF